MSHIVVQTVRGETITIFTKHIVVLRDVSEGCQICLQHGGEITVPMLQEMVLHQIVEAMPKKRVIVRTRKAKA